MSPTDLIAAIQFSQLGVVEVAVSLVLMGLQTFLPFIPFFVITGANVAIWGFAKGSVFNYVGAFLGDSFAYWLVRRYGRAWVVRLVPERTMAHWMRYFQRRRGFVILIISRLVPLVPAGIVNMAAGLADMDFRPFALGTLIGNVPATLLNGLLGYNLFTFGKNKYHLLEVLAVFAILTLLGELWLRLNPSDDEPPRPARRGGKRTSPPAPPGGNGPEATERGEA